MNNEKLTRKEIIDNRLKQAGWNVTDRTQVIEEFDIHLTIVEEPARPYAGHQYSDYVLLGKDGKPLAVVEAKKTSVDATLGREQAKQYCHNIQQTQGGDLPFCFYTNGHDIYFWDLDNYPPKFETLKDSIVEETGKLPLSINSVATAKELIEKAQTNHYWAKITEADFDELIEKLAPLMKFREAVIPLAPAKFNLKDIVAEKEFVEFGPQHEALSVAKYRELVEKKINELVSSSPILQKLKQGQEITTDEAEQLAEELHNEHPHITIDLLRKVYNHRKAALVQFIKHILGIEELETFAETVTKAFDDFVSKHSYLTSRQLQFLDLLKNFVLDKGAVSKPNLIESPFTMLHPEGIRGVINQKEIDEILRLTEKVLAA